MIEVVTNCPTSTDTTQEPSRIMEVQSPVRSPLALGLTEQEQTSFDALLELCRSRGYLDHPVGLSNEDVRDGLNDETTLL